MKMCVIIDRVVIDSESQSAISEAAIAEGLRSSLQTLLVNVSPAIVPGTERRSLTVNVPPDARPLAIGASLGTCLAQFLQAGNNAGGSIT
jgi:hypothetical protein